MVHVSEKVYIKTYEFYFVSRTNPLVKGSEKLYRIHRAGSCLVNIECGGRAKRARRVCVFVRDCAGWLLRWFACWRSLVWFLVIGDQVEKRVNCRTPVVTSLSAQSTLGQSMCCDVDTTVTQ